MRTLLCSLAALVTAQEVYRFDFSLDDQPLSASKRRLDEVTFGADGRARDTHARHARKRRQIAISDDDDDDDDDASSSFLFAAGSGSKPTRPRRAASKRAVVESSDEDEDASSSSDEESESSEEDVEAAPKKMSEDDEPMVKKSAKASTRRGYKLQRRFTAEETQAVEDGYQLHGDKWAKILRESAVLKKGGRSSTDIRDKWRNLEKKKKSTAAYSYFTPEEDAIILEMLSNGQRPSWVDVAARIPGRDHKQVRERWANHLDPNLKKGDWTPEEDAVIAAAHARWGNAWTKIAELLPGRAQSGVQNRWNSAFRRNNAHTFGRATGDRVVRALQEARRSMEIIDRAQKLKSPSAPISTSLAGALADDRWDACQKWTFAHASSPYPSAEDKAALARETGRLRSSVNDWFQNMRVKYRELRDGTRAPRDAFEAQLYHFVPRCADANASTRRGGAARCVERTRDWTPDMARRQAVQARVRALILKGRFRA